MSAVITSDESRQRSSRWGEGAAIAISLLALLVSVASFYFSSLRIVDSLSATISAVLHEVPGQHSNSGILESSREAVTSGYYVARVLLSNTGNRPAVVLGVRNGLLGERQFEMTFVEEPVVLANTFPIIVPPHDVRLLDVRLPLQSVIAVRAQGEPTGDNYKTFQWYLEFETLDSNGHRFSRRSGSIGEFTINSSGSSIRRKRGASVSKSVDLFR